MPTRTYAPGTAGSGPGVPFRDGAVCGGDDVHAHFAGLRVHQVPIGATIGAMHPIDFPSCLLPASGYRRERWRNGLGWTHEILRLPARGEWQLRLSVAEVDQSSAFSPFPGIEREIVLLEGEGMQLQFADGETVRLAPPHGRLRFDGGRSLIGTPLAGPTRDYNAMWQRAALQAQLFHRPLQGSMLFTTEADVAWSLYLLAGQARFPQVPALAGILHAGDSAWLGAGRRQGLRLEGAGELLAVRWSPAAGVVNATQ